MRRCAALVLGFVGLVAVGLPAWSGTASATGAPVIVVIDSTGFDTSNPALAGHVVDEVCLDALGGQSWEQSFCPGHGTAVSGAGVAMPQVTNGAFTFSGEFHGTAVASEVLNVDPTAQLIVIRALYSFTTALSWVAQHAANYDIAAVVYSMSGPLNDPSLRGWVPCDQSTETVGAQNITTKPFIDALAQLNVPVVIAAGNDGNAQYLSVPACISSAVSVAASDGSSIASYSNVSTQVSIVAPGTATVATENEPGQFGTASQIGTSFAAPYVGAIFAIARAQYPTMPYTEVLAAMRASGARLNDQDVSGLPVASPAATMAMLAAGTTPTLASTFTTQVSISGSPTSGSGAASQQLADALTHITALETQVTQLQAQVTALTASVAQGVANATLARNLTARVRALLGTITVLRRELASDRRRLG